MFKLAGKLPKVSLSLSSLKRIDFGLPREVDVLVWGSPLTDVFLPDAYSQGLSCKVLDTSGKSVNFWCAVLAIWKLSLGRDSLYGCYLRAASSMFSPKVILTFVDNDWQFWQFSRREAPWRKVIVQNGLRTWPPNIEKLAAASNVDLFFCFGEQDKTLFGKSVGATKILVRGSFRSNREPILRGKLPLATWISQYERGYVSAKLTTIGSDAEINGRVELKAVGQFFTWAVANGLRPRILLRNPSGSARSEARWFKNNLPDYDFDFSSKDELSSYQHCDLSTICATLGSTLGVEALTRGTPVVFFLDRPEYSEGYVFLQGVPEVFKVSTESKALYIQLNQALRARSQVRGIFAFRDSMARDEGNRDFWLHIKKIIDTN